jgi:hypothetical protein
MDEANATSQAGAPDRTTPSSSSRKNGTGLLSKLPFLRGAPDGKSRRAMDDDNRSHSPPRSMSATVQQQKSRPRKGSLRKVALLGRGVQRERRESKQLTIDTTRSTTFENRVAQGPTSNPMSDHEAAGLSISDVTPRPSMDGFASRSSLSKSSELSASAPSGHHDSESLVTSPTVSYTSTTDEEDILHLPAHNQFSLRPDLSLSSGSESYFPNRASTQRRRSIQQAKSPLSYSGLSTTPLPAPDADWDYAETERWGWMILVVTWFVFVIGMGSCLGVWTWAWDVGTTPYAPPELEDDPTLPIVGYYPALIILTCVMAWVWVVVAWVGMKYFRHAKISGD